MLKRRSKKSGEGFIEIDSSFLVEERKINVKVESLKSYSDVEKIQNLVREGNIVFLKIKDLKSKDLNSLKRAIERLRKTCMAIDGDIVGVDEDYVVVCPSYAKVFRGK